MAQVSASRTVGPFVIVLTGPECTGKSTLAGELADLARWTGGQLFVATSTSEASAVARQIVGELRQQYVIGFEPGATPGWHAVDVRVRRKGHTVQTRSGYVAGAARPVS